MQADRAWSFWWLLPDSLAPIRSEREVRLPASDSLNYPVPSGAVFRLEYALRQHRHLWRTPIRGHESPKPPNTRTPGLTPESRRR